MQPNQPELDSESGSGLLFRSEKHKGGSASDRFLKTALFSQSTPGTTLNIQPSDPEILTGIERVYGVPNGSGSSGPFVVSQSGKS
jgi:hypothetical protein